MRRLLCAEIQLESSELPKLKFYAAFVKDACKAFGADPSSIEPLRTKFKKYTVLKSAFKYKQAQETYERRTYIRKIDLFNTHPDTLEKLLFYVNENCTPGIVVKTNQIMFKNDSLLDELDKEFKSVQLSQKAWLPSGPEPDENTKLEMLIKEAEDKIAANESKEQDK